MQSRQVLAKAPERDLLAHAVLLGFEVGSVQQGARARAPRETQLHLGLFF